MLEARTTSNAVRSNGVFIGFIIIRCIKHPKISTIKVIKIGQMQLINSIKPSDFIISRYSTKTSN